jgi:hypothetical protein
LWVFTLVVGWSMMSSTIAAARAAGVKIRLMISAEKNVKM